MEKQRYKVICPNCNEEFDVAKSIFMEMGLNMGSCSCPKCKSLLYLEADEDKKVMITDLYINQVKKLEEERKEYENSKNDPRR